MLRSRLFNAKPTELVGLTIEISLDMSILINCLSKYTSIKVTRVQGRSNANIGLLYKLWECKETQREYQNVLIIRYKRNNWIIQPNRNVPFMQSSNQLTKRILPDMPKYYIQSTKRMTAGQWTKEWTKEGKNEHGITKERTSSELERIDAGAILPSRVIKGTNFVLARWHPGMKSL